MKILNFDLIGPMTKSSIRIKQSALNTRSKPSYILLLITFFAFRFNNTAPLIKYVAIDLKNFFTQKGYFYRVAQAINCIFPNQNLIIGVRVLFWGKIGNKDRRSKFRYQEKRSPISVYKYNVNYAIEHSYCRTGVFGLKLWFFSNV